MEIIFFGGKGGVGKTTISSAYAVKKAEEGKEVLLISTDPAHSLSDIFEEEIKGRKKIRQCLTAIEVDVKEEMKAYKSKVLKLASNIFSPQVKEQLGELLHTLEDSPGIEDVVILEALSRILTEERYDIAVVDTAPTGHTLGLLKAVRNSSRILKEVIGIKRRIRKFRKMAGREERDELLEILEEREKRFNAFSRLVYSSATFVPVLNPERLPILETERLIEGLEHVGIRVNLLIVNKVLPEDLKEPFFHKRKEIEKKYLRKIEKLFPSLRKIFIPLLDEEVVGYEKLKDFARKFLSI